MLFGIERRAAVADAAAGGRVSQAADSRAGRRSRACAWPRRRTARRFASSRAASTTSSFAGGAGRMAMSGLGGRDRDDRRGASSAQHAGIERFTIGQRKGLGVAMGEPYFVVRIEPRDAARGDRRARRAGPSELTAADCNWLVDPPAAAVRAARRRFATTRRRGTRRLSCCRTGSAARAFSTSRGTASRPARRWCVYDGDRVLGGGWIE